MYIFRLMLVLLCLIILVNCRPTNNNQNSVINQSLLIAAAANLEPALSEVAREFQNTNNIKVTFSYGATGNIARQLENGAPFDLFYAADVKSIDSLITKGQLLSDSRRIYGRGRLVVWWPPDSSIIPTAPTDLIKPEFKRIAIANPELAPYGLAAKESLTALGIWAQLQERVVYGENVSATHQYARTGNVELAFIPLSLVKPAEKYLLIDEKLHSPLEQAVAINSHSKNIELARKFDQFLQSEKGRVILERFGYVVQ